MSMYMNIVETEENAQIVVYMYRLIEGKTFSEISLKIPSIASL
jgi:hypothetical protein